MLSGIYRKSRTTKKQKSKEIFRPFRPVFYRRNQAMYVCRHAEARSCSHCGSGEAIITAYCECVPVLLPHLPRMKIACILRRTLLSPVACLPRSTIFFLHYLINGRILGEKLLNTKCVF